MHGKLDTGKVIDRNAVLARDAGPETSARVADICRSTPSKYAIFSVMSANDKGGVAVEGVCEAALGLEIVKVWVDEVEAEVELEIAKVWVKEIEVEFAIAKVGVVGDDGASEGTAKSDCEELEGVVVEGSGGAPIGWR